MAVAPDPGRAAVAAGLVALYLLWGSTYLAMRWLTAAVPLTIAGGVRFVIAGAILVAVARSRGAPWPDRAQLAASARIGAALFLGSNGLVMFGVQRIPSGVAALLIALVPVWLVAIEWLRRGRRVGGRELAGIALGLVGVAVLVAPSGGATGVVRAIDPLGALAIVCAAASWALGSSWSRDPATPTPDAPAMAAGLQMGWGGVLLSGLAVGTRAELHPQAIDARVVASFVFLVVGGSIVGFLVYAWLLRVTTPAVATTYAYVNPLVAAVLGWAFGGEPITTRLIAAGVLILAAVAVITAPVPPAGWALAAASATTRRGS